METNRIYLDGIVLRSPPSPPPAPSTYPRPSKPESKSASTFILNGYFVYITEY